MCEAGFLRADALTEDTGEDVAGDLGGGTDGEDFAGTVGGTGGEDVAGTVGGTFGEDLGGTFGDGFAEGVGLFGVRLDFDRRFL